MEPLVTGFTPFGTSHWVMLALFVAGIWPVVQLGRAQRGTERARRFSRVVAVVIPCFTIPMQVIDLLPGAYDVDTSLPLHLCDYAWIAAVVALWTHHRFAVALTYYWGLVLTSQAIITPALGADFPSPKFLGFWGMHYLVVWTAIYLAWGLRLTPRWRDYATTVATTATWAVATYGFDLATDTNYGYLVRKPGSGSILDLLGPWPVYVVAEIALVALVWALMTWPWVAADGNRRRAATIAAC